MPLINIPSAPASDMTPLLQPNSSLMGSTNTPIPLLMPDVTITTKKIVVTINQPWNIVRGLNWLIIKNENAFRDGITAIIITRVELLYVKCRYGSALGCLWYHQEPMTG